MNRPIASRLARQWESPPTWLLAFGLAVWLQARFLPLAPPGPAARMSGWVLIAAGLVLVTLAVAAFRRERTTILPRETPTRRTRSGAPTRRSRAGTRASRPSSSALAGWRSGASTRCRSAPT